MPTRARHLEALVIHDTTFPEATPIGVLGTDDVALYTVSPDDNYLKKSRDVLEIVATPGFWGQGGRRPPDLMYVDADFKLDVSQPALRNPVVVDPRGLLYGAVLAAMFRSQSSRRPFGFTVYTQNLHAVAEDPYALTFFAVLHCLSGEQFDKKVPIGQAAHEELVRRHGGRTPELVLPEALVRYRASLIALVEHDVVSLDDDSFLRAQAAVERFRADGREIPRDIAIAWTGDDGLREELLLRSLFADCRKLRRWKQEMMDTVQSFLEATLEFSNRLRRLGVRAREVLATIDRQDTEDAWSHDADPKLRALVFLMAWARARCRRQITSAAAVGTEIGLDAPQVDRALASIFPGHRTQSGEVRCGGGNIIRELNRASRWPFPGTQGFRAEVVRYLVKRGDTVDRWPDCLRPEDVPADGDDSEGPGE